MRAFALVPFLLLVGCQGDSTTAPPVSVSCETRGDCPVMDPNISPEVLEAIDDATARIVIALDPAPRAAIEPQLNALHVALLSRDVARGRLALHAALAAITKAERDYPESAADYTALRLAFVPAAQALLLDSSVVFG